MLLSLKDFAKAVGVKYNTLRQHIYKQKVYKSGDFIDTEYALNKVYIEDQTKGVGLKLGNIDIKKSSKDKLEQKPLPNEPEKPKQQKLKLAPTESEKQYLLWESEKKQLEIQKLKRDNQIKQIEIDKKLGRLMPVEMVEKILTVNIQTIFRDFENDCDNLATIYVDILGGNRTELSEISGKLRERLQKIIEGVKEKCDAEVKGVIKDFAQVVNRGDRRK